MGFVTDDLLQGLLAEKQPKLAHLLQVLLYTLYFLLCSASIPPSLLRRSLQLLLGSLTSVKGVQQPCSNPGKCSEKSGKASFVKYAYLQVFCIIEKPPENHRASLIRKRSLVRVQAGPLAKYLGLQGKRKRKELHLARRTLWESAAVVCLLGCGEALARI